jgi:hypothetical protein
MIRHGLATTIGVMGKVWRDQVRYGNVGRDMVWPHPSKSDGYGKVRRGIVSCGMVRYGNGKAWFYLDVSGVWRGDVRYGQVRYGQARFGKDEMSIY